MAIQVRCDECNEGLKAPDEAAGQSVKCPGCGHPIQVPAAQGNGDTEGDKDDAPYKLSVVATTKRERKRCWSCNCEISPQDVECPDCGVGLKKVKRLKPSLSEKKQRKRKRAKEEETHSEHESLFGAFIYAFAAVLRDKGSLCCLWCAGIMTFLPIIPAVVGLLLMCVPFAGPFLYLALMCIVIGAAPAGILSRNMEIASRWGSRKTVDSWHMSISDEMVPSSIEILKANALLGLLPLFIAGFVIKAFDGFVSSQFGGSPDTVGQVGIILGGLVYFGAALASTFCGPMCIMLLGAGSVGDALFPPNVFKVLVRTFPQYIAFYFYIVALAVATYILAAVLATLVFLVFGSVASLWETGSILGMAGFALATVASLFVVSVVATYFAAIVGWSMGIFIHRNYEHFEAIRD